MVVACSKCVFPKPKSNTEQKNTTKYFFLHQIVHPKKKALIEFIPFVCFVFLAMFCVLIDSIANDTWHTRKPRKIRTFFSLNVFVCDLIPPLYGDVIQRIIKLSQTKTNETLPRSLRRCTMRISFPLPICSRRVSYTRSFVFVSEKILRKTIQSIFFCCVCELVYCYCLSLVEYAFV